jgi:N-methylhydantoinase B
VEAVADEIFRHLFVSVAEEMGVALERTAYSPNIKERRDYSCVLFDAEGRLVAQAAHIPVHLGAFPQLMEHVRPKFAWRPGDVVLANDPFIGGTHLPDISVISPAFAGGGELAGFVANRAHHADIGGSHAGSMGAATSIFQEGLILPPVRLYDRGTLNEALLDVLLRNVRTPAERRGDLAAQLAANATGVRRLEQLVERYELKEVRDRMRGAQQRSRLAVEQLLADFPAGRFSFTDYLDDDGDGGHDLPVCACVHVEGGRLVVDFTGSAPQQRGPVNATRAVTLSAVGYVMICLLGEAVEINQGVFDPLDVRTPPGTLVDARPPAAVAAGNVETSQRIVDAVLGALAQALPDRIPAASQGTMNNLSLGGVAPGGGPWAYYETLGGGTGGSPAGPGISGVHSHMSNTRNTPAEALEYHYPLRVWEYSLREGSGGLGRHGGGEGITREIELLSAASASFLTERRRRGPYGLAGGESGQAGMNEISRTGEADELLPPKASLELQAGARIRIRTPGGGGWGPSPSADTPPPKHDLAPPD